MIRNNIDQSKHNHTDEFYNHYLALDWSEKTMAYARLASHSQRPRIFEKPSDLRSLKEYLSGLKGRKILTIEETTTTHWLYVELLDFVDRILICDTYRNRLLSDGPKNDKIDAAKLCQLLRSGMLKEVYHSTDKAYEMRKLLSAYNDYVKTGTRFKNQKSAFYRAMGLKYKKEELNSKDELLNFINDKYNNSINDYKEIKQQFIEKFEEIGKSSKTIKNLMTINGIGIVWAMTIYTTIVDAKRFSDKYKFWSYCGLTYNLRESGGRNYGRKRPRHSRELKNVFHTAAKSALSGNNDINNYYEHLLQSGKDLQSAYNAVVRYIAKSAYAIMRNKERYRPYAWRENF